MKQIVKLAILATTAALMGEHTYGQSAATNTYEALVIQGTNTTPVIEISPEVRAEMLIAAAEEIGRPGPNDLDDLVARHDAMKQKMLVIQRRQARAGTNAPTAASAPVASQKPAPMKPQQPLPIEQLDQIITQLSAIRSQMSDTSPSQAAK